MKQEISKNPRLDTERARGRTKLDSTAAIPSIEATCDFVANNTPSRFMIFIFSRALHKWSKTLADFVRRVTVAASSAVI